MTETLPDRRCVVCHATYAGSERFCPLDGGAIVVSTGAGPDEHIGRTLDDRYLVRKLLGRGGMGAVYEADHVGLDRRVAIKFLLGDRTNRDLLARFRREARVASKIVHEHVVQIFDVGTDESGIDFIVMEFLEGRDLKRALADDGPFSSARAIKVGQQILRGLHAIHEGGILHRDIKPANILLTERGRDREFVKIMDFGISKVTDSGAPAITQSGQVLGTPQYMSPEQLSGLEVDRRSDLYAVGLTLYELVAGGPPFRGTSTAQLAAQHLTDRPRPLEELAPDVPLGLVRAIERALDKNADRRFATALEFAEALELDAGDSKPIGRRESVGRIDGATRPITGPRDRETKPLTGPRDRETRPLTGAGVDAGASNDSRSAATVRSAPPPDSAAPPDSAPVRAPAAAGAPTPAAPQPRSWSLLALVAALVITVPLGVYFAMRKRSEVGTRVAVVADAAVKTAKDTQHLAYARDAERAGKLELAIAGYQAAYDAEPNADHLYRIGELYERLRKPGDSVAAYQRYLDAAPTASDAAQVRARMAALTAPTVDAGATSSGESGAPPTRKPTAVPTTAPQTGRYCRCAREGKRLCSQKGERRCRCEMGRAALCQTKPRANCEGTYSVPPELDAHPCRGYLSSFSNEMPGIYMCSYCQDTRTFRGQNGQPCRGYDYESGIGYEGKLHSCNDTP